MSAVKYVGRSTCHRGKRLFDILARLKGFGVGRILYRNMYFERYPEPSYYVITKVKPDMTDPTEAEIDQEGKGVAWGVKVWRGEPCGEEIIAHCHRSDWRLVHRLDEAKFLSYAVPDRPFTVLPSKVPLPPLFEHLLLEEKRHDMKHKQTSSASVAAERPMMRLELNPSARVIYSDEEEFLSKYK